MTILIEVKNKTVLKRSSAVVVSGKLSKKQKVMYNLILSYTRRALKYNPNEVSFSCPALEFFEQAQIDKDSWIYAKKLLKGIQSTYLEKDTLGIDGSGEWFMENLITSSRIKEGVVRWGMSNNMINLIKDTSPPELIHPYVIVDLVIQHNFTKHGLTLYELALHWLPRKSKTGNSGLLDLDQVRELFDVNYPSFSKLNQDVLQNAINSVNDPENGAPFLVELEVKRKGRVIEFVRFLIERIPVDEEIIDIADPSAFIKNRLLEAGLHTKTIKSIIEKIEKSGKSAYFGNKINSIVERYKNHKDRVRLTTGAVNSELNQLVLPFDKAGPVPRTIQKKDIKSLTQACYLKAGEDCETRKRGYSSTDKCSKCFDLYKLPVYSGS